jgi:CBS domain containing-hemolysin-like protein
MAAAPAHASLFEGETLDAVANGVAWVAIVIAPIVGIAVFWLVHILPEKIAEQKKHPQAQAINTLCLLSLFFGGLLWPLAWIWAYSKPVMYKLAYGTDVDESHGAKVDKKAPISEQVAAMAQERAAQVGAMADERAARVTAISQARDAEMDALRKELADLRQQLKGKGA